MRFLFSRRWVLFAVAVVVLAWGASLLGQWQFHRLDDRRAENTLVRDNLDRPPVPVADVLAVGRPAAARDEWRKVTAHGTWDDEHTIVVKYRTRDGAAGVDVVTPLVTGDGAAVLVDRGWMATQNSGGERPDTPPVTDGPVTVTGYVRVDGSGGSTTVTDGQTRAISSTVIGQDLPYRLYGGFLDLQTESPPPAQAALAPGELPDDTSEGPHFFYGLQWWFFGVLAVAGFCYLAYDEWRRSRREPGGADEKPPGEPEAPEPSEALEHAAVDGEHRAAHE